RWFDLAGKPLTMKFRRGKEEVTVETSPAKFEFSDKILAATNPENGSALDPLPPDPRNPNSGRLDYFAFWRRLKLLTGQFMTVKVKHKNGAEEELTVPPAYALTLGFKPRIGQVTAIRAGSAAEAMGVSEKDTLQAVLLSGKSKSGADEEVTF